MKSEKKRPGGGVWVKRKLLCGLLACLLLVLSGCAGEEADGGEGGDTLHILATTYPVYLFVSAVTEDVEGVEVSLLVNQPTSCLHDYTLTVSDMKAIEGADVIVINGVGLEDFMADALARSDAVVIDCSEGVALLPTLEHAGHDHGHAQDHDHEAEYDPHIWMDPDRAARMVENIYLGLSELDAEHEAVYWEYAYTAIQMMRADKAAWLEGIRAWGGWKELPQNRELITFHDGFQYFADAFGFTILKAVEEEEGATASAAELKEITALIRAHDLPAIFTEVNGSEATARALRRETGVEIGQLTMLMSGEGTGLNAYLDGIGGNVETIVNLIAGRTLVQT